MNLGQIRNGCLLTGEMHVRVIAGKARSIPLKTPKGLETRPTTDRIKETLFNMIQPLIPDAQFLDLYAGSGGIAIEALSRGAAAAVLVERNSGTAEYIRDNLKKTRLEAQAEVLTADAAAAIDRLAAQGREFDLIFMDPPYHKELEKQALERIVSCGILKRDGLVIVEAAADTEFSYLEELGLRISRVKRYQTNQHVFIEMIKEEDGRAE